MIYQCELLGKYKFIIHFIFFIYKYFLNNAKEANIQLVKTYCFILSVDAVRTVSQTPKHLDKNIKNILKLCCQYCTT